VVVVVIVALYHRDDKNMDIEDTDKYELDITKTVLSNIPGFGLFFLIYVFISKITSVISSFESPEMRLMTTIVFMFAILKMMSLSMSSISNLEYKPRKI